MKNERSAPSEPVTCPYCGRPLKWMGDRWHASFDCERCGQFSDFGEAAIPPQGGTAAEASQQAPAPQSHQFE